MALSSRKFAVSVGLLLSVGGHGAMAFDDPLLGLPPVPVTTSNPQTPEKIALGKKLFFDKRLSADGTVSCETCHSEFKVFTDGLPVAEGINNHRGTRNTPTLLNAAYFTSQFWDGRRVTFEEQAPDPFVNAAEHGFKNHAAVIDVIRSDTAYRSKFQYVFAVGSENINISHVAQAIAAFERTLVAGNSAFDRFYFGKDATALTPVAQRGLELFRKQAGCARCHTIEKEHALFTDNQFHNAGVGVSRIEARLAEITTQVLKIQGVPVTDLSRNDISRKSIDEAIFSDSDISELGRFNVTHNPADIGRFKTPTLRNVALTAPYMHDGSVKTLEEVIESELYARGDDAGRPLILTPVEKQAVVTFLRSITSAGYLHSTAKP